jgi:glycerol-3-phosphate acyltransferase PlsY
MTTYIFAIIASYALGCVTTGYYLVRAITGDDLRTLASGAAGSRNAGRRLGVWGFIVTFCGDAGKGSLVVWLAGRLGPEPWLPLVLLLGTVAGHIWPLQLRWRGGKGFATFAGGMLLFDPYLLLTATAVAVVLWILLRSTVIAGLAALALSPALLAGRHLLQQLPLPSVKLFLYTLLTTLILYAHRQNIRSFIEQRRTATQTENR